MSPTSAGRFFATTHQGKHRHIRMNLNLFLSKWKFGRSRDLVLMISVKKSRCSHPLKLGLQVELKELIKNPFLFTKSKTTDGLLYSLWHLRLFFWVCNIWYPTCCSVTKLSPTLWPHGLQHTSPPCPSLFRRVCSNSCPFCWWCLPTILSSVAPFSSCP